MALSQSYVPAPGGVVDEGVLQQGAEHEEDTDAGPDVHGLGVGDWWEAALDGAHGGGHGQEGGHPQGHPRRHRLVVQPEGEPGDEDDHEAGDVDGEDVEGELPGEHQVHLQAAVGAWPSRG